MPTSADKITIEIYRADRQAIAEIEAELMHVWAASGGEGRKPTVADAVHYVIVAASYTAIERSD